MRTIREYMDSGIKRGFVKNDALIAVKCEVTQATVSRWRSGDRIPEDEEIMRLAETLGVDPWELLTAARYHKAKNSETKTAWEGIAAKIASYGITATVLIMTMWQTEEGRAYGPENELQRVPVFRIGLGFLIQCFALLKLRYDGVHRFMRYGFQPIGKRMNRDMSALLGHRTVLDRPTYSLAAG